MTRGRVIIVFRLRRPARPQQAPLMGEAAGRLADFTVITAEDPRTEHINDHHARHCRRLAAGRPPRGRGYVPIADRAVAIAFAVQMAQPGDLVIVTGKANEQSMLPRHGRVSLGRPRGGARGAEARVEGEVENKNKASASL